MIRKWFLLGVLFTVARLASAKDDLPVVYIDGTNSVCPGYTYTYLLYSNLCPMTDWTWSVTGGSIISYGLGSGGGGGGIGPSSTIKSPGSGFTAQSNAVLGYIVIEWTSTGTKNVTADFSSNPCGGQTSAGYIGGSISFKVPNLQVPTPSAPTISAPGVTGYFCDGQTITVYANNSENTNGATNDDVYIQWEVSVNGGSYTYFNTTTAGSTTYTPTSSPLLTSYNTFRFRISKTYQLCSETTSNYSSASAGAFVYANPPDPVVTPLDLICTRQSSVTFDGGSSNQFYVQLQLNGSSYTDLGPFTQSSTLPNLPTGAYTYQFYYFDQVKNSRSACPSLNPHPFTISDASYNLTVNATPTTETCYGYNDGKIDLSINGSSPYSFSWTKDGVAFGSSSQNLTSLVHGTYASSVTDYYGCTGSASAVLNQQPLITVTPSVTHDITCVGDSDGEITVSGGGGTSSGYTYSLDGGSYHSGYQASNVFINLMAGTYTATVKDSNGCTQSSIINLSNPSPPVPGTVSAIDPTCLGSSTGKISISGSNGANWSIGGGYQSIAIPFTGVTPGPYSVTVKDSKGCPVPAGSVTVNPPITAGYLSTVASCSTVNDGSITVTNSSGTAGSFPTGGTGSYMYSFNNGAYQSSNTVSGLGVGTYTVKVNDANCTLAFSATVLPKTPVTGAITQTSFINCFGQTTAAFNVVASGGTSPYTSYSWSNGASGTSVSGVGAGTYTVTITDSKGCQGTKSIPVTQPTQLTGSTSTSNYNGFNISCKGGNNGTINLTPSGATSPYTYSWSTGSTAQNLTGLTAGNYSVTITDAKSCTTIKNVTLTEPAASVSAVIQSKSDVTCFGANNGMISILGSGGTGALSYSLDGGATYQLSSTFTSLAAGSYSVIAKDVNNCTATSSIIIISTPTALNISSITKNNPLCNGSSTGSIVVTAVGGTTPYQYSKDGTTFNSSNTLSGLTAGSYVVTVKDGNGCTISSATQVLTDPVLLTQSSSSTNQSCAANSDGTITLNGAGGTTPYTFSIDGGTTFKPSGSFTGLVTGAYSIKVKDNNGCLASGSINVGIQTTLSGAITQSAFINCFNQTTGALTLATSGGTSPYTYAWTNGSTSQNISSLGAGSYSVTIKDSKNCTASQNKIITQPTALALSNTNSNYNGYGVSCQSAADGFINVNASGGTSPYTYSWTNGATSSSISSLTAGTYTVTVTDSKSCTVNSPVTLAAPAALTLNIGTKTNVICNGGANGSITLSAGGGAGGYSYSINGGTTWQLSSTFSSLSAGSFTLQVKDLNNCSNSTSTNITQPSVISISIGTIQSAGCGLSNGSIQSSATGGTGTLNYQWKNSSNQVVGTSPNLTNAPSGVYTLTVTDQNTCSKSTTANISSPSGPGFSIINTTATSCSNSSDGQASVSITSGPTPYTINWGNGETGTTALHLSGGSNTVTVLDGNNCSTSQSFTIATPAAIALSSVQALSPSCPGGNDGSIQVTATGGKTPYSYTWNGVAGSSTQSGLNAGSYSLTVTDANNCVYTQAINVADVPVIAISVVNQISPTCSTSTDGSLLVQASGGNGSFNYTWNTGATGSLLSNIGAGTYTVTAKDSKNCLQQKAVSVGAPAAVAETLTAVATSCNSGSDGMISVSASGGTGAYSYSKDNGNSWQSQNTFASLVAGTYTILSKDQNGCSISASTIVTEPSAIVINISKIDPTCGLANGSAQTVVSGGTGTYTYQWQNSLNQSYGNNSNLQSAPADTYTLTARDANLCNANTSITLAAYASAQFNLTNIGSTLCSYSADGSATVQVSTAQAPYTISWSSGETTATATKLVAGQNTVTLTDANQCQVTKTIQVPSPQAISVLSEAIITPVCVGGTGSIQVTSTGGTGSITYSWNGTTGQNNIQNIKAGTYNLVIKDGNGCSFAKAYTLSDPPPFVIDLGTDVTICPNTTTSIGLTLPNATYVWSGPGNFASTQGVVNVGDAGKYSLTVTNTNGCQASDELTISISNNLLKADFLSVSQAHAGDTLILIDISWPIPDQVQWHLSDSATVIYSDKDYALISFSQPGTYTVGVAATLGGCENQYFQKIIIDDQPRGGQAGHGSGSPELSSLTAYPNPFVGKTNARIELSQPGGVTVKVYSLVTNLLVMQKEFDGDSTYDVEMDFNTQLAGLYIIIVESGSKTKAARVIKL